MKIKPDYLEVLDNRNFCLENARKKVTDDATISIDSNVNDINKQQKNEDTRDKDKFRNIIDPIKGLHKMIQKYGSEDTNFKTVKNEVLDVGKINDWTIFMHKQVMSKDRKIVGTIARIGKKADFITVEKITKVPKFERFGTYYDEQSYKQIKQKFRISKSNVEGFGENTVLLNIDERQLFFYQV